MDRRELIQSFGRHWFPEDAFVAYPDHPLLSRGPDLLGRDDRGLVAAFLYSSPWSRPSSPSERGRVLLSRFALPEETSFCLIVADSSLPLSQEDAGLFDETVTLKDSSGKMGRRKPLRNDTRYVFSVLKEFHTDRFAKIWTVKEMMRPNEVEQTGIPTSVINYGLYKLKANWLDFSDDGILSAEIGGERGRAQLVSRMRTFATAAAAVDYGMGAGLPFVFRTARILQAGDGYLPIHRAEISQNWLTSATTANDVLKPFRVAAFAGAAVRNPTVG